jgi:hypothetical protein
MHFPHGVFLVCTVYCVLHSEIALSRKPFGIGHMYIYTLLLRMTDTMTSQNTDLSSWDTLYIYCHRFNFIVCFVQYNACARLNNSKNKMLHSNIHSDVCSLPAVLEIFYTIRKPWITSLSLIIAYTGPMKIPPAIRIKCLIMQSETAQTAGRGGNSGTVLGTTMWNCGDYTNHSKNIYHKSREIIN